MIQGFATWNSMSSIPRRVNGDRAGALAVDVMDPSISSGPTFFENSLESIP